MRFFLLSHSVSWERGSVTSENTVSVLHHQEGTPTGGAPWWRWEQTGVPWHRVTGSTLFAQPCQLSGEFATKGASPRETSVASTLVSLLVLGKAHFSSSCPVSQISRFVTTGISRSCGKPGTLFSLCHPCHLCNEGFCFSRQSLWVNLLDLMRAAYFAFPFRMLFAFLVKP